MESASSETNGSNSEMDEERSADISYVGRNNLQVRYTTGSYTSYHGPLESMIPFIQGVREFFDKVKGDRSANLNPVALTCVLLNAFYSRRSTRIIFLRFTIRNCSNLAWNHTIKSVLHTGECAQDISSYFILSSTPAQHPSL